jgi:gamma-glutamyltranspeptidase
MTLEDLGRYKVEVRDAMEITYRDYKLTSSGAPSSGAVALNIMKTVEGYSQFGTEALLNLSTHRFDEAVRFGYGAVSVALAFNHSELMAPNSEQNLVIRPSAILSMHFSCKCFSRPRLRR